MKIIFFIFVVLWITVNGEIRLLSPYNKQAFYVPQNIKSKCREHPAVHIDFKWTPIHGVHSYVLVIEKQKITKHEDGYERTYFEPLIKSDEIKSETNRYFYDAGFYRWSVMGRNAKGDLDRESSQYFFTIV